jgi:hypothetical protein
MQRDELELVMFENELQLTRIEESCFAWYSLKSIDILLYVGFADPRAFTSCFRVQRLTPFTVKCPSVIVDRKIFAFR